MPPEDLKPLTSLRFVAASMIVALHASNYFPWAAPASKLPLNQGVSFFFVLSGFILTHVYSHKPVRLGSFLRARLARLWPVHFVTCMLVLAFIRPDSQQLPGTGFFNPWVVLASNLTLTHSVVPFINYTFSWNSPSWSVSTEMFFYLAFPFLLVGIDRNWYWKLGLSAAVIGLYAALIPAFHLPLDGGPGQISVTFLCYSSPLFRGFEFVLGMSAYVAWRRLGGLRISIWTATAAEFAVIALLPVWYWASPSVGSAVLVCWLSVAGNCWIFAVLILIMASGAGLLGRILSLRLFVWLGEISFPLYMVHQIVMKWISLQHLEGKLGPVGPLPVIIACLAAAALLHHLVEEPARRALRRGQARRELMEFPASAV